MLEFFIRHSRWIMVAFAALVFASTQTRWFNELNLARKAEGEMVDLRYNWRGSQAPHPDIVLVGVQASSFDLSSLSPEEIEASETLQAMLHPWPWNRAVFAAVVEKIAEAGAKVVVLDIVFAAQSSSDPALAEVLRKYSDKVVIGSAFLNVESEQGTQQAYLEPNPTLLFGEHRIVGYTTTRAEINDVIRRGKHRTSQLREFNPALDDGQHDLISMSALAVEKFKGSVETPPYWHSNFIDYAGPQGTYPVIPIEELFVESLWNARQIGGGTVFRDKIVLVGPFAEILHDVHPTPFGSMPGPEIQANMMATLLQNSSLRDAPFSHGVLSSLVLVFAALLICFVPSTVRESICLFIQNALVKALVVLGVGVGFVFVSHLQFIGSRMVVPMVGPLAGLLGMGAFGIIFRYALEQVERKRVRNVLEKYVSKNVAQTILSDPRSFVESFRGRKQPVTVLFSDIRGFTTMTEGTDAEKLVAQLNEYFLGMVEAVLQQKGTLQKFIGDAIMAVWGDTHTEGSANDAARAVATALKMRSTLLRLNKEWEGKPNRAELKIGIGVNHGEVVVGNIGHPLRMEFTVLGDGVNLAARLESATKQFHTDILIGETVEALTRDRFIYRAVDLLTVKGKTRPVEVFELLGDRSEPPPPWLAVYHEAVGLYRQRCFEQAIGKLKDTRQAIGGEDFLCEMYLERCAHYLKEPPSKDWDGSFTLTDK